MAAASAMGEKLALFVIGKSKTSRCFKDGKQWCWYTVVYCRAGIDISKNARMSCEHFKEWVENLDQTFRTQGKKVALLVDNCAAHPHMENLSNINLIFLPPNITLCFSQWK